MSGITTHKITHFGPCETAAKYTNKRKIKGKFQSKLRNGEQSPLVSELTG